MVEILMAVVIFGLLCLGAGAGVFAQRWFPAAHQTPQATQMMQLTVGLLATFAAVVLGLLTASVKHDYDASALDRQQYALELNLLDSCLYDFGASTALARNQLRGYTAAVIASTWPREPAPQGVVYPDTAHMARTGASPVLGAIMEKIGIEVSDLGAGDPRGAGLAAMCRDRYGGVANARLSVIEDARNQLLQPFYEVLIVWLMIIFACHGLIAPRTRLMLALMILSAISLSSVMFVIMDLGQPYGGFFSISSAGMRATLQAMLARS